MHNNQTKRSDSPKHGPSAAAEATKSNAPIILFSVIAIVSAAAFLSAQAATIIGILCLVTSAFMIRRSYQTQLARQKEAQAEPAEPEFVQIVRAYSELLKQSDADSGPVDDVSRLPYGKQQIKDAIIAFMGNTDDKELKEHLQVSYLLLSRWQETGRNDADDANNEGEPEPSGDSEEEKDWEITARKEQAALKQELAAQGLW